MNAVDRLNRRLRTVFIVAFATLVIGVAGYVLIEGWPWDDALYMTVITLTTVGYGEVHPLTKAGRFFSVLLMFSGIGVVAYSFAVVADYLIAGELTGILRRQRMKNAIRHLQQHYVICGYGRVGQQVVEGLRANANPVVVIDAEVEHAAELDQLGVPHIVGDATDDNVLLEAGIERARGLCTCLPSDAANVFIVLSARTLNANLFIISRSNQPDSERKLRIAGANQIINPYLITGHRMAALLLHPGVVEFLDVIMRRGDLELRIEEVVVGSTSEMHGKTLAEARVRTETGANVLAVRRRDGKLQTDMNSELLLESGDALIALGTEPQLAALARLTDDEHHALRLPD